MDRAEFVSSLFAALPAVVQDPAGHALASSLEFAAVCAAYLGGRCGGDEVLRAAA